MERKLASIQKISKIESIKNSDFLDVATINGWQVVTQKSNNLKVDDLVIFFEVDSLLPICEQFEFLEQYRVSEKNSVNGEGYRLKTIKLRGQVSQGLILPIHTLFHKRVGADSFMPLFKYKETVLNLTEIQDEFARTGSYDLTEILGVKKYEKPLPAQLAGTARGNFPSFLRKTDQERIQNCFKDLTDKWIDHNWEVTIKLDGSSFTAYYRMDPMVSFGEFGVCSRNLDLKETEENSFWQAARKYDLENKLRKLGRSIAIQGELMGPGIQGNKEILNELKMYVFDIFDIDTQTYLDALTRKHITHELGLDHVPFLRYTGLQKSVSVQWLLELADGPSMNAEQREGLVFKSITDPNVSFKVISNKWLLKNE